MYQDDDEGGGIAKYYSPVSKMSEKAAKLRTEIADLEASQSKGIQLGRQSVKIAMSDCTSAAAAPGVRPATASTRIAPALSTRSSKALSHVSSVRSAIGTPSMVLGWRASLNSNEEGGGAPARGGAALAARPTSAAALKNANMAANAALLEAHKESQQKVHTLENDVTDLKLRVRELTQDLEHRQSSYMRREDKLQSQVKKLEQEVSRLSGERPRKDEPLFGKQTKVIKELHKQMDAEIEALLDQQAVLFQKEEHDNLKRFKDKLNDAEAEIADYRASSGRTHDEWAKRTQSMRNEMESAQELAMKFDQMYRLSNEECSRLRAQFKAQEEDREHLVKQVVGLKAENKRLFTELGIMAQELKAISQERDELRDLNKALEELAEGRGGDDDEEGVERLQVDSDVDNEDEDEVHVAQGPRQVTGALAGRKGAASPVPMTAPEVKRYEQVLSSLRKLLEAEKQRTRQARAAHMAELQQRTELQALMRQCVEDIRDRRVCASSAGGLASVVEEQHSNSNSNSNSSNNGRPQSASPGVLSTDTYPQASSSARATGNSGRPLLAHNGGASRGTPFSAHTSSSAIKTRPMSAQVNSRRPMSVFASSVPSNSAAEDAVMGLSAAEREELVKELIAREEVMKLVFEKAFPGMAPHPPGDPYLDRMAAFMEQRDQQVVGNARHLDFMNKNNGKVPTLGKDVAVTPGGPVAKEGASKPWVLNVDAMLSDFLQSSRPGGADPSPSSRAGVAASRR